MPKFITNSAPFAVNLVASIHLVICNFNHFSLRCLRLTLRVGIILLRQPFNALQLFIRFADLHVCRPINIRMLPLCISYEINKTLSSQEKKKLFLWKMNNSNNLFVYLCFKRIVLFCIQVFAFYEKCLNHEIIARHTLRRSIQNPLETLSILKKKFKDKR